MDKLKYIKLENPDGSYSESIPLSVDSDHVDVNGNTLTNELNNKANNSSIDVLQSQINGLASGNPLAASSISEMIDTSKIYVNTTDGYWYYYNGTNWIGGGIYQATSLSNKEVQYYHLSDLVKDKAFKAVTQSDINYVCANLYQDALAGSSDSITSGEFILFKKGDIISLLDTANYKLRVNEFDLNKNYIKQIGYNSSGITIDRDCFARISVSKNDGTRPMVSNISNIINFVGLIEQDLLFSNYKDLGFIKKIDLSSSEWEVGAIADLNGEPYAHTKRVRTINFHEVEAGDFINININTRKGYKAQILMYDLTTQDYIGKLDDEDKWCDDRNIIMDRNCYIKLVLYTNKPTGTDALSTLTISDLPNFNNMVSIYKNINSSLHIQVVTSQNINEKINEVLQSTVLPNSNNLVNSAHRGYFGGNALPENTIEAYKYAVNKKFDCIETDVRITSDNIPVICHDGTINRVARNFDGTTLANNVYVESSTFQELNQYDYGIYKGSQFAGTRLLTFEEVCRFAKYNNIKINIDCKAGTAAKLDLIYACVQKYGLQYQVRWTLSDYTLIAYLLNKNPKLEVALGAWDPTLTHINNVVNLRQTYPLAKILLDFYVGNMTNDIANSVRNNDIELSCYCENNNQIIKAINYGATYLTINLETPYNLLKNTYYL